MVLRGSGQASNLIAEHGTNNVLQKRYAFDLGSSSGAGGGGEPLVQHDASGNRNWMMADELGSVVALANDSGAMTSINTYDEYGTPGPRISGARQAFR